jgi:cell division protein FtsB
MDFRLSAPKIRLLSSREERLHALARSADEAEALADRIRGRIQPFLERLYGVRRRIATTAVALITIWLFVHVMLGPNGMVVYRSKRAEYQDLHKQIQGLQSENAKFSDQIQQLKTDPKRIEKEAREQFHYARPGEVVYVAPEPPPGPASDSRSASK